MICRHCGEDALEKFDVYYNNGAVFYADCDECYITTFHIFPKYISESQKIKYMKMVEDKLGETV